MSIRVMSQIWEKSRHGGSNLLAMLAIADFADDEGRAYPAVPTLAKKCRVQVRAMNYTLRYLQESGELDVRLNEGPRGTNLYRVAIERLGVKSLPLQPDAPLQRIAPLQKIAQTPAKNCTKPLQPVADEPSLTINNHQSSRQKSRLPACQTKDIVDLYHTILPELPQVRLMGEKRQAAIAKMWKWVFTSKKGNGEPRARTNGEAVEWFHQYFERARDNDFVMGRCQRSPGHENWSCNLDYLLTDKGKVQVIEKTGGMT